jgi:geranylgeranyl diphosphate synthase type I
LVGKSLGGNLSPLVAAAVSIEMIHNFTIIHDDIMDESPQRRHRPTLWAKWGSGQAINAGDGVFALAYQATKGIKKNCGEAKTLEVVNLLTEACLDIVEGQMLDMSYQGALDVPQSNYITMVSKKTGVLLECACRCGATLSSKRRDVVNNYGKFGLNLGIAFQIRDDYLGVWGDEELTGKPSGIDISERKKSYPAIWTLENSSKANRTELIRLYKKPELSNAEIEKVKELFTAAGADKHTKSLAYEYYDKALKSLRKTGQTTQYDKALVELARFLIERDF